MNTNGYVPPEEGQRQFRIAAVEEKIRRCDDAIALIQSQKKELCSKLKKLENLEVTPKK